MTKEKQKVFSSQPEKQQVFAQPYQLSDMTSVTNSATSSRTSSLASLSKPTPSSPLSSCVYTNNNDKTNNNYTKGKQKSEDKTTTTIFSTGSDSDCKKGENKTTNSNQTNNSYKKGKQKSEDKTTTTCTTVSCNNDKTNNYSHKGKQIEDKTTTTTKSTGWNGEKGEGSENSTQNLLLNIDCGSDSETTNSNRTDYGKRIEAAITTNNHSESVLELTCEGVKKTSNTKTSNYFANRNYVEDRITSNTVGDFTKDDDSNENVLFNIDCSGAKITRNYFANNLFIGDTVPTPTAITGGGNTGDLEEKNCGNTYNKTNTHYTNINYINNKDIGTIGTGDYSGIDGKDSSSIDFGENTTNIIIDGFITGQQNYRLLDLNNYYQNEVELLTMGKLQVNF